GMESLAPALVDHMEPVLDLVDEGSLLIVDDPERVRRRAHDLVATTEEFLAAAWTSAAAGANSPLDLSEASFASLEESRGIAQRRGLGWWNVSAFEPDPELAELAADDGAADHVQIDSRDVQGYRGDREKAVADLQQLTRQAWRLILVTEGPGPARRLREHLLEAEIPARMVQQVAAAGDDARRDEDASLPAAGMVLVTTASVGRGFVSEGLHLAVFTEAD